MVVGMGFRCGWSETTNNDLRPKTNLAVELDNRASEGGFGGKAREWELELELRNSKC